ncbi:MAG TPA: hypothetical protein DF383_03510 [Deltaproteobacteria bacterium]|nr:hypothetical protein [Deltaproteobacteria bacterium]
MRRIATFSDQRLAQRFSDFLQVQGIANQVDTEDDGTYNLWVLSDEHLGAAEGFLAIYRRSPEAPEFDGHHGQAESIRRSKEKKARQSNVIDLRTHWHRLDTSVAPVTLVLIVLSVAATALVYLDKQEVILRYLFITDYEIVGSYLGWRGGLSEILHGQVWRLFTPMFIHFGLLHILFNMLWLKDLGTVIERKQGSLFFLIQVLLLSALSNFGQYYMSGPSFGGMSGVVYGLFGYIWIRGRYDPSLGLSLNPSVVTMMIVWFFLCLTGLVGNVANWAHGVGLVTGMAWGFLAAKLRR